MTGTLAVQLALCADATVSMPASAAGFGVLSHAVATSVTLPLVLCVWFAVAAARARRRARVSVGPHF